PYAAGTGYYKTAFARSNAPMLKSRISWIVMSLVLVIVVGQARPARADAKPASRASGSVVAIFELDGPVLESPTQDLSLFGPQPLSLRELVGHMREAADDQNVKAVVVLSEGLMAGAGQVEEISQAIAAVREKGKE